MEEKEKGSFEPLSDAERCAFRRLFDELGEPGALARSGLSRVGAYRALAGLPVRNGTRSLIRDALREQPRTQPPPSHRAA